MKNKVVVADEAVDLRRGIDHIGVSASFIVHDGQGKVLLQKRGQKCRDEQGTWDSGGAIEFGETVEEAIVREINEELGTKPLDMEFLKVFDVHRENNGRKTHWITIDYAVKVDPKTVKIGEPDKFDQLGWFNISELPTPLHSTFDVILEKYKNKLT